MRTVRYIYTIIDVSKIKNIKLDTIGVNIKNVRYNSKKSKILCKFIGENHIKNKKKNCLQNNSQLEGKMGLNCLIFD